MSEERLKEIKDSIEYQKYILGDIYREELDEELELYNEVIRLREELSKCTRKHWQSKCAEHCINEKLLQTRIDKDKEIERLNNIINVIKEELSKDFCSYVCKNRTYGKTFKAGAEVYKEHLLYKIKELENGRSDE